MTWEGVPPGNIARIDQRIANGKHIIDALVPDILRRRARYSKEEVTAQLATLLMLHFDDFGDVIDLVAIAISEIADLRSDSGDLP